MHDINSKEDTMYLLPYKSFKQMSISKWIISVCISLKTNTEKNTYTVNNTTKERTIT